jgi:hypothetical protein
LPAVLKEVISYLSNSTFAGFPVAKQEDIRDLAQKPHEPQAAFLHCAKPHRKFEM